MAIRTIGVLTSGGDAPGMNAGIRAVVRTALNNGIRVKGINHGYQGLIENEFIDMDKYSVSNTLNRGGTILYTARSKEFMTDEGRKKAYDNLLSQGIDCLIVLGGDGSFKGALELSKLGDINVIGIPATIDLDIACTEYTIGFDTAINTAMDCIDKIRDTSTSHERCSIVEVMGRQAGYIALHCGISSGAEEILIPERREDIDIKMLVTRIKIAIKKGKKHYLIVNAEGIGHSEELAKKIQEATGVETRATILGHLQRGGIPSCKDRVYASIMGVKAVESYIENKKNKVIVYKDGEFVDMDMVKGLSMKKTISNAFLDVVTQIESK
ncbi:MAG: 6-phosphofructokinase [Lachnospiraceae bacterium]|nr:6-phosphofructokinase [Lachnospiraceae bacterium]